MNKFTIFALFLLFSSFECNKNEIVRKLENPTLMSTNIISETEFTETDSVSQQKNLTSISSDKILDKSTSIEERETNLENNTIIEEVNTSIEERETELENNTMIEQIISIEERKTDLPNTNKF